LLIYQIDERFFGIPGLAKFWRMFIDVKNGNGDQSFALLLGIS
jgi:hypothetical protein